jgi:Uma2 family endonuclease
MAMPAVQEERVEAEAEAPGGEPISERRLAWETLRARDLEEKMGQGAAHGDAVKCFVDVSVALREEQGREAYIGWDVFIEWDPNDPRARVSPDMFLLDGQSPFIAPSIWNTWQPGCDPPSFALEIVSKKSRTKDYDQNPPRYAALGVDELVVFDAEPHGEETFALQLYRRTSRGQFLRMYAGTGPVRSKVLRAWLVVVAQPGEGGPHVRLARDAEGTDLVLTGEERATTAEAQANAERERANAERERANAERERANAAEAQATAERERANAAEAQTAALEARLREMEARLPSPPPTSR